MIKFSRFILYIFFFYVVEVVFKVLKFEVDSALNLYVNDLWKISLNVANNFFQHPKIKLVWLSQCFT